MTSEVARLVVAADSELGRAIADMRAMQREMQAMSAGANAMAGHTGAAANAMKSAFTTAAQVGTVAALALGAGLAAAGGAALKLGTDFESAGNQFAAVANISKASDEFRQFQETARAMGADLDLPATSARSAALAMVEMKKAGMENAAVFGEVKGVLQLGAAAMIDEARAAQIVTGAMNAFKAEALSATQVADMFANAANASAASMTDVSQGFAQASAAFAQANQSALHLTTGIAALANVNISGSDAGTALKNAITRLIAPTDEARAVMQQLGINVFDAQGNMLGLPAIIDQFNAALAPLTQEAQGAVLQTILLSDGMKAMGPLLDLGSAGFNALAQQIGQQGAAASLAQAQMQGLQGAVGGLSSQVETAATDLATPFLEPLAQIVSQVAAKVPEIAAQFQPLAGQIASNIVPAFDSVVATFSTVASAVSPLLGALMSLFNMFSAASNGTITFQTALSSISPALSPLGSMIDTARAAIGALTAGLPPLSSILTTVAAVAGGVFVGALLALQAGLLGIGAVVNFVVGNWQTFAVIAGVAAGALAGYAAATAYAAAATLAASITAAGGLTMWAGKAVMTWVTSQMAAAGITSAWLAAALPFVVVGAAIAAFAVAYATNAFGVRDTTLQVVEQIKAGWSNLVANVSAIGEFLRQPVTNIGEAWGTLQSTMAANNAAYQAQLDTIATGTAATRGMVGVEVDAMAVQHGTAMGSMMESTSVASQAIQAIMRGDFGALPGIVGGNMEALKGMFGGKLGDMIAQAAEAAAQIRAQLASVTGVVGAGATGAAAVDEFRKERFNAQAAEAKATAAAAANAGKATGAAVKAFGSNALPATSGAAKAIKSVDEQVRDAAQAIAAVSDTVAKLKEFLSGGKLEGLDAGDTAGKIIAIAQNLTNMGRAFADQFAAAGKGLTENALKAAQQLAEGVSSSTGALGNTVGYLQKLHEFMTSPAWAIMSDTAVVVEVSGQLSQMGRAIFDAFSGAAVGLEQGAADASKVLAEGIGAASSGLSSLVGLLPKLWEFMNDPAFGEIMNAQGRIVAAAAQLSALGRSIFEGFARASAGIGEDAVAGAKVLSEGVGAATSALTATLDFVAKLVVALGDVDIVAAIGTSEGRARMVAASAQLTQLARAIFVNFAAASQGIETVTVTAAKGFAEAVTAVVGALGGVLDFIGKLVTALGDVDARAALETDAGRTMVVHFGFVLASLGRLLLLNFSQVGADVGSVAVAAAKRFGEGVQAAVGALGAALDFVVKLVAAVGDTSVQAALMSQAGASRIVHFGHTLSSLGRALLLNFVAASAGLGSLATAAAKRFGEGVQAAVGALGGVLDFTHKLLTALGDTSLRAALLADEGRGRIIHFAHTLSGLARAFLLNFAAAGTGLGSDTTTAAKLLADGVQAAVGALGGVLDVTQKILAAVADVGLRSALLDADALGGIRHFAFVLGNLGRAILTNFAAASTIGSDTLTAAKVLADGIGAATSGLGAVLDIVPRLLDVVTRQQPMLAALMTHSDGVKGLGSWLAIWGRELVRVFASAAASLSSVEAAGAKPLTDAVGGVADALSSLLGVLPQLLEVVLRQSGMLAALMANSDGVKGLALWFAVWGRDLTLAVAHAAGGLDQASAAAAGRLTGAVGGVIGSLRDVLAFLPVLLDVLANQSGFLSRLMANSASVKGLAVWLATWGRELTNLFATAAAGLSSVPTEPLRDAIGATLGGLTDVLAMLSLLATASIPTTGLESLKRLAGRLASDGAELVNAFRRAANQLELVSGAAAGELVSAVQSVLGGVRDTIELLRTLAAYTYISISTPLVWATVLAQDAHSLVAEYQRMLNELGAIGSGGLAAAVAQAVGVVLSGVRDTVELLQVLAGYSYIPISSVIVWVQTLAQDAFFLTNAFLNALQNLGTLANGGLAEELEKRLRTVLGTVRDALDLRKLLSADDLGTIPAMGAGTALETFVRGLVDFAQAVTEVAQTAAADFAALATGGLEPLATASSHAKSVLDNALAIVKLLVEPPALPDVSFGSPLRVYLTSLVEFLQASTEAARDAAADFAVLADSGLSQLATAAGHAKSVYDSGVSIIKLLVDPSDIPTVSDGSTLHTFLVDLVTFVRDITRLALDTVGAFTVAEDSGLSALSSAAGHAKSVFDSGLAMIKLLVEPPSVPNISAGTSLHRFLVDLLGFARQIATMAASAADGFQTQATEGLTKLADAFGKAKSVLDGMDLVTQLQNFLPNFSGLSAALQPKLDLLFTTLIDIARQFAQRAQEAGISEAWQAAAATVADVFDGAQGSISGMLDLIEQLSEVPHMNIPTPEQLAPVLADVLDNVEFVVREFAARAAAMKTSGVDLTSASGLADTVGSVFDAIGKLGEQIKAFTGFTGGSGLNNIKAALAQVFDLFGDFTRSGQAADVQAAQTALSSILGGLANLSAAGGTSAGVSFMQAYAAAITANGSLLSSALAGVLPSAAGGGSASSGSAAASGAGKAGGANVQGDYIEKQVNVNLTQNFNNSNTGSGSLNVLATVGAIYA